jgi:Superinfection immunity protein
MRILAILSLALATAGIYFLPLFVAVRRTRRSLVALAFFNVLVGWTVFGWIAAMLWARHPEIAGKIARNLRRHRRRQIQATVASIIARSQARADESTKSSHAASHSNF